MGKQTMMNNTHLTQDISAETTDYPSSKVAWITLFILAFTYMFSFLDRQILVLLIEPIKQDLQISDTEVSLLSGLAFGLVYTVAGVFMGRAADLWVRKYVIIIGVAIWSLLTMACGFAQSFIQLFLARMGVGFGEAALTPTAYAMIPDLFRPDRLGRAMSIFVVVGVVGGMGASLLMGGLVIGVLEDVNMPVLPLVGEVQFWQMVLMVVGAASFCMIIPLALMREPARHGTLSSIKVEKMPFRDVLGYLMAHKAFYLPFTLGVCFLNIIGYGTAAWFPSYFIRVMGWEASTAGINMGLLYIPSAMIGGIFAGWLADKLRSKGYEAAGIWIMITGILGMIICTFLVVYVPFMGVKLVAITGAYFSLMMPAALFPSILQQATLPHIRAQISALFLFAINMAGLGLGPTFIAVVTDYVFRDGMAVGHSIVVISTICGSLSIFILLRAIMPFKAQLMTFRDKEQAPKTL